MNILVDAFFEALPSLLVVVVTLGTGWLITQRVSARWDFKRRRRELDLAALAQFYQAYGTFFSVWKVWTCHPEVEGFIEISDESRQDLLDRASAVEGSMEALFVKLAVERNLTDAEQIDLACFREGVQCLRESIEKRVHVQTRGPEALTWSTADGRGGGLPYNSFKRLAGRVALIASSAKTGKADPRRVQQAMINTTSSAPYRENWWESDHLSIGTPTSRSSTHILDRTDRASP